MSTSVTGARLSAPADWPVVEERRRVSVLFADIVGSTGLVERLDPEEVRALQRAYFDTVAGVVTRWGGVVEKYVGDAVMALFGARESDGFDAYRAVRAGLEVQRVLDGRALPGVASLRTRVGVATGEALVDVAAIRDGAHGMASGAVITAAARLQEHAPPGGVVVCAATRRATAGLIAHRTLPPLTVAGKPLPMDVAVATGPTRPEPAGHHGRLVGRRRQLATARDLLLRAVRERRPRWVSLVGQSGSGRSRSLHELRRAVDAVDGVPVRWCVAACPPRPEQPSGPAADLLRAFAGLRAGDCPAAVRRGLLAALDGLVAPARVPATVVALEGLLDGSFPAGAVVWQRVLLRLAEREPVVLAVDDLDRAAPATHRFLRTLFTSAAALGLPLAVVATHRPEWADTRPAPGDRRVDVPLPPLAAVEAGRLLRGLLTRAGLPAALAARLLPLVGGVPGHAEAYVRRLADGADPAAGLPERVRAAVGARLDACDGAGRAATMVVAALGPAVDAATVDRALDWTPGRAEPILRRLAGAGLLRRACRGGYDVADPALRAVAGDRLPRSTRADIARRAGLADGHGPRRPAERTRPAEAPAAASAAGPGGDAPCVTARRSAPRPVVAAPHAASGRARTPAVGTEPTAADTEATVVETERAGGEAQPTAVGAEPAGIGAERTSFGAERTSFGAERTSFGVERTAGAAEATGIGAGRAGIGDGGPTAGGRGRGGLVAVPAVLAVPAGAGVAAAWPPGGHRDRPAEPRDRLSAPHRDRPAGPGGNRLPGQRRNHLGGTEGPPAGNVVRMPRPLDPGRTGARPGTGRRRGTEEPSPLAVAA
ncbi:adenylate/guanylate cyclase domain-containing protein [Micromonospora okii]|uniref:adenylate/guanylate cyclase domain-containing protein n=1 Tax=Micromonospora okii TaxID=1182970 RepID=UPI001E500267|nr:adenylate/guanylate cyclase domain-containing protein [Micromonospora okii]